MTKVESQLDGIVCRYCGLASGVSHARACDCVDALLPYLTDSGDLPAYAVSAQALGLSEGAVKVAVHRLRRRFGAILRLEIAETVLAPEDVEDELRELIRVVSA